MAKALDALIKRDLQIADDVRQIEQYPLESRMPIEDSKSIHRALLIMHVSKNLERIADHAQGIADMVTYMITGENVRHLSRDEK